MVRESASQAASRDLAGGGDRAAAAAAIAALSPAIELADFDVPPAAPEDVEAVLKGNIFQRHVLVGPRDETHAGGRTSGLVGRVIRRGAEIARTRRSREKYRRAGRHRPARRRSAGGVRRSASGCARATLSLADRSWRRCSSRRTKTA